jgi:hypothetical protein
MYTYSHREGGEGGELTREKFRGAIVYKAGRKHKHDCLYPQSPVFQLLCTGENNQKNEFFQNDHENFAKMQLLIFVCESAEKKMLLFNPTSDLLPVVRGGAGEADHHLPHLLQVFSNCVRQSAQPLLVVGRPLVIVKLL